MKYKVVGIKRREGDFKSKEGKDIHYISHDIYYQDLEAADSIGVIVEKETFSEKAFNNMMESKKFTSPDQLIKYEFFDFAYNKSGKAIQLI